VIEGLKLVHPNRAVLYVCGTYGGMAPACYRLGHSEGWKGTEAERTWNSGAFYLQDGPASMKRLSASLACAASIVAPHMSEVPTLHCHSSRTCTLSRAEGHLASMN